eukprot:3173799-Pleurochrysis_carterae.AAC.2
MASKGWRGPGTRGGNPRERRAQRAQAANLLALSMRAAKLFAIWAVTEAVFPESHMTPTVVIAVGVCDPAAAAVNAAPSGKAQMQRLLGEVNIDADRLSHPELLAEVAVDVKAASLRPRRARVHSIDIL